MSLLSCPLCLNPHFNGLDELRSSLISVATTSLMCPVCGDFYLGLDKLTIHLFSHITSANKPKQVVGSKKIPDQPPQLKNVNEELSKEILEFEKAVQGPTIIVAESNRHNPKCNICNLCFSDEEILDLHQKLLHQTPPDKKTGRYNYHCHLCSKQFRMRGSLMVHLRVAHFNYVTNNTKKSYSECGQANSVEKPKGARLQDKHWQCEVCLKSFTTKYFLKKHNRLHTGEMPYYCTQCNKYFTFQQSYHKHMLYHSDEKPHVCAECGRAFKELSTLHNHQRIHSGERPFSCETCGKSFRQRVSYLIHRRIHTGVMPYKCTACHKSFRYKVSHRSHKCPVDPPGAVIKNLPESQTSGDEVATAAETSCENRELFTLILSQPVTEELSQPVTVGVECMLGGRKGEGVGKALETINEKSFKEMLYGTEPNTNF